MNDMTREELIDLLDSKDKQILEMESKLLNASQQQQMLAMAVKLLNRLLQESTAKVTKLQAFKDLVHKRLDDAGVPHDPNPDKTSESGCRIGNRLAWVLEFINRTDT